ncbi:S-layer homology domain-containing protein [Desulfurispora thermophila]|uniref:S-layer homology domain-containing protein n=1 Tax=Desulfurispora thermophila TaxID=265470 RepID=UPI00035CDB98|nr:S-layer homology domain-containing protein [Desulfurispora thermophila]
MRRTKSLVFVLVLAVLALGLVTSAYAASFSDVIGTKYEEPIKMLNNFGIASGYPDGTIKPDNSITRAEFAKIVVTEMKMADGVVKGNTKFKDVDASHWASGYINVAVGQGILKGYPDGTFRPDANVTNAEAVTMLVRMLGYGPAVNEADWPNSYLAKGAEVGVLDGVNVEAMAPAKRGDVFMMAANAFEADVLEQTGYGSEQKWEVTGKTFYEKAWKLEKVKDLVVTDVPLTDGSLDDNEIKLAPANDLENGKVYEIVGTFDPNRVMGLDVDAFVDTTSSKLKVYSVDVTTNKGDIVLDKVKSLTFDPATKKLIKVKAKGLDKEFNLSLHQVDIGGGVKDGVLVFNNGHTVQLQVYKAWDDNSDARKYGGRNSILAAVTSNSNTIKRLWIIDTDGFVTKVKRVDTSNEKIITDNGDIQLDTADYRVYRNNQLVKLEDIKAGDIINVLVPVGQSVSSPNFAVIYASDATITGDVTKAYEDGDAFWVEIGGKKVELTPRAKYEYGSDKKTVVNADGTWNSSVEMKKLINKNVTAYLDAFGEARLLVANSAVEGGFDKQYGVVVSKATLGSNYELKVRLTNGQKVTYTADLNDEDTYAFDFTGGLTTASVISDIQPGSLISFNVGSNNMIDDLDVLTTMSGGNPVAVSYAYDAGRVEITYTTRAFDKDDDYVNTGNGIFDLASYAAYFDATTPADTDITSLKALDGITVGSSGDKQLVLVKDDSTSKKAIVLVAYKASGSIGAEADIGILVDAYDKSDGRYADIFVGGKLLTDVDATASGVKSVITSGKEDDVFYFKLKGNELDSGTVAFNESTSGTVNGATYYEVNGYKAFVIDKTDDTNYWVIDDIDGNIITLKNNKDGKTVVVRLDGSDSTLVDNSGSSPVVINADQLYEGAPVDVVLQKNSDTLVEFLVIQDY